MNRILGKGSILCHNFDVVSPPMKQEEVKQGLAIHKDGAGLNISLVKLSSERPLLHKIRVL